MNVGTHLFEAGWRQGSAMRSIDHHAIKEHFQNFAAGDRLIVISQSCDIVKVPDEAEPVIELIVARPINALDGNFTYNKNSRILHVAVNPSLTDAQYFSLTQNDKFQLERPSLIHLTPDPNFNLEVEQIGVMARWLASRYQRPAFPETFNSRVENVKQSKKKLRTAAKKISKIVSGIFIDIYPFREIEDHEHYNVNLMALVPAGQTADLSLEEMLDPIKAIVKLLETAGMEVKYELRKEDTVPLSLFRDRFKQWSFDEISLREDPPHELDLTQ